MRQCLAVADTTTGGTITAATNATPIQITSNNHNLATGQQVTISGVAGNTAANGTWTVSYFDANNFTLNGSAGNAPYTAGGIWTLVPTSGPAMAITAASNSTPVQITSAGHGLVTGQRVTISGVGGNTAANGTWTITVVDANNFTLNGSQGNAVYTAGGTWVLFTGLPITVFGATPSDYVEISGTLQGVAPTQNFLCNTPRDLTQPTRRFRSAGGAITGASNPASPITISTATTAGLAAGQKVIISGVQGNTAANGTWTITNVTATTFDLVGTTSNAAYTSGGTWLPTYTTFANDIPTTAANYTTLVGADLIQSDLISFDVRLLPAGGADFLDVFQLAQVYGATGASSNPAYNATTGPMVFDAWSSVKDDLYDYSTWATPGTLASIPIWNNGTGPIIKAIQIIIRVWDSKTEQTRQVTLVVAL
jgi:hypothetical protein